jgi:hypothetical protein
MNRQAVCIKKHMQETVFDISFEYNDKTYTGLVTPSDQKDDGGRPISFDVVINGQPLGQLSFQDCKWFVDKEKPSGLVKQIGKQIEKHFQF